MNQLLEIFSARMPQNINWDYVSKNYALTESFIEQHAEFLNWDKISKYQRLSLSFISSYANRLNWKFIAYKQKLSPAFILKHKNQLKSHQQSLTYGQDFDLDFIENNIDLVFFKELEFPKYYSKLPFSFYKKNSNHCSEGLIKRIIEHHGLKPDEIFLKNLPAYNKLNYQKLPPQQFLEKHSDKINWSALLLIKDAPEELILKHRDKINWNQVHRDFKLSQAAIEDLTISGHGIHLYRKHPVSMDFLLAHQEEIDWSSYAISNPHINETIIQQCGDLIPVKSLYESISRENYSLDFIRKHKSTLNWHHFTSKYFHELRPEELDEFHDFLDWPSIFRKEITYDFILKYQRYFTKNKYTTRHIHLFSLEEIDKMKDFINWDNYQIYYKLTPEIAATFSSYVNWNLVSRRVKLNQYLIENFWKLIHWENISAPHYKNDHLNFTPITDKIIAHNSYSRFPFLKYYNHRKYPVHL